MERVIVHGDGNWAALLKTWFARHTEKILWEVSRGSRIFTRRFGVFGWSVFVLFVIGAAAWLFTQQQLTEMDTLTSQQVRQNGLKGGTHPQIVQGVDVANGIDDRARLKIFDDYLLPHKDIPVVVQELLSLANESGLSMPLGEYRSEPDLAGSFVRYHMSLPVKGEASAIHSFIQAALYKQKTLALDSVVFKRERSATSEIEARIQWVVLARLTDNGVKSMAISRADGGDTP